MSQIVTQNPGSSEIQSPLIAGITEGLNKLSSVLNLKTGTLEDVQLTAVPIDNDEKNKNRIFEANFGNRLWLSSPAPVIKKNGSEITQSGSNFTIDYIGGSITFPVESKPSDGDIITVSATYIIAESEALNKINTALSAVQTQSDKYKGNYDNVGALQLAHASAQNGDYAIVFDPLAVYAWKNDGWYDTRSIEDLNNYYTKDESNNLLNQKEPKISAKGSSTSDDNYYWGGRKTWQDLFAKVRSVTLTGLSAASDAVVSATDTVLTAIGKLQAQVSKNTQKAYLSGTGAPSTSTVGSVGQRYVNTSTSDEYICEEVSGGTYTWKLQVKSVNGKTPSASGGNIQITADDVNALGKDDTAASAESANSLNGLTKEKIEQSLGGISLVVDGSSNSVDLTSAENRIDSVTVHGFTTQDGSGDPSPSNVREIKNAGMYNSLVILDSTRNWNPQGDFTNTMRFDLVDALPNRVPSIEEVLAICEDFPVGDIMDGGDYEHFRASYSPETPNSFILYISKNRLSSSTLDGFKEYLRNNPIRVAYQSTENTGKHYTGIEVKQGDDYHCTIVEINDRLHDGDTLETNVESEFDSVLTLTGDESYNANSGWKGGAVCIGNALMGAIPVTGYDTVANIACSALPVNKPSMAVDTSSVTPYVGQGGSGGYDLYLYLGPAYNTTELAKQQIKALYDAGTPIRVFYQSATGGKSLQRVKRSTYAKRTLVLTGTETITSRTSQSKTYFSFYVQDAKSPPSMNDVGNIKCNMLAPSPQNDVVKGDYRTCITSEGNLLFHFTDDVTTVEQAQQILAEKYTAGTPVTLEYEIAKPEVYADVPVEIENPKGTYTVSGEDGTTVQAFISVQPTPENIGALPVSGTAQAATKLASPVNIGSASFDGSQSITLAQMGAQPVLSVVTEDITSNCTGTNLDIAFVYHQQYGKLHILYIEAENTAPAITWATNIAFPSKVNIPARKSYHILATGSGYSSPDYYPVVAENSSTEHNKLYFRCTSAMLKLNIVFEIAVVYMEL